MIDCLVIFETMNQKLIMLSIIHDTSTCAQWPDSAHSILIASPSTSRDDWTSASTTETKTCVQLEPFKRATKLAYITDICIGSPQCFNIIHRKRSFIKALCFFGSFGFGLINCSVFLIFNHCRSHCWWFKPTYMTAFVAPMAHESCGSAHRYSIHDNRNNLERRCKFGIVRWITLYYIVKWTKYNDKFTQTSAN